MADRDGGPQDTFAAFAGDPDGGRLLRDNLTRLAQQLAGTALGDRVQRTLDGHGDMRTLALDAEFAALVRDGAARVSAAWDELEGDDRHSVVEQARRAAAEARER